MYSSVFIYIHLFIYLFVVEWTFEPFFLTMLVALVRAPSRMHDGITFSTVFLWVFSQSKNMHQKQIGNSKLLFDSLKTQLVQGVAPHSTCDILERLQQILCPWEQKIAEVAQ